MVEGRVEATLENSELLEITPGGAFKGRVSINEAIIAGEFDGELVVRGRLLVASGGRIVGTIKYGSLVVEEGGITITPGEIRGVDITTQPFPGFPTDLQAPFMALLTTAKGTSVITEKIYENRMQHVAELQRMGASIRLQGNTAVVEGVTQLSAAPVNGSDLRAAAAMVIAALKAQGTSRVSGLNHLDRGYDAIEAKLTGCGAQLQRWNP